jgi:MurNAc alpha-1-phosphate uridylyltransferase
MTITPPTSAMLLAAGFGSRLRPMTDKTPKPLIKCGGITLLERAINNLVSLGMKKIYINTHYKADVISNYLLSNSFNAEIVQVHEPEVLGTGGGILNVMERYQERQLLIHNSDIVMENIDSARLMLKAWDMHDMDSLSLLQHIDNTSYPVVTGDFSLNEDQLSIAEPRDYIFTGIYLTSKRLFAGYESGNKLALGDILRDHIPSTRIRGFVNQCKWFDTGTLERLQAAESFLQQAS